MLGFTCQTFAVPGIILCTLAQIGILGNYAIELWCPKYETDKFHIALFSEAESSLEMDPSSHYPSGENGLVQPRCIYIRSQYVSKPLLRRLC